MRKLAILGTVAAAWAVPATSQQAPEPELELLYRSVVKLGEVIQVGETGRGVRRIIPIVGGTFEGPNMRGEILPMGWDWQLERKDGCTEIIADYFLKTDDGVVINVVNTGVICMGEGGAMMPVRTHPVFEAPRGKYEWLSKAAFVGTLEPAPPEAGPAVRIRFYRVR